MPGVPSASMDKKYDPMSAKITLLTETWFGLMPQRASSRAVA
jgi:hypothetical protein